MHSLNSKPTPVISLNTLIGQAGRKQPPHHHPLPSSAITMRLGTLILAAAAATLALLTPEEAQASFLARVGKAPRASCTVTGQGFSQPRSDFARFMAVRGGMQVRASVRPSVLGLGRWVVGAGLTKRGWLSIDRSIDRSMDGSMAACIQRN